MKRYKRFFKETLYFQKDNKTILNRKLRIDDVIPVYNYERRKIYNYKILKIIEFSNIKEYNPSIIKSIQDYYVIAKLDKGSNYLYKIIIEKDGTVEFPIQLEYKSKGITNIDNDYFKKYML